MAKKTLPGVEDHALFPDRDVWPVGGRHFRCRGDGRSTAIEQQHMNSAFRGPWVPGTTIQGWRCTWSMSWSTRQKQHAHKPTPGAHAHRHQSRAAAWPATNVSCGLLRRPRFAGRGGASGPGRVIYAIHQDELLSFASPWVCASAARKPRAAQKNTAHSKD